MAFRPDGRRIVSASDDKTLKVWDAESGQETLTIKGHTSDVLSVAFSPDGRRIVSGGGSPKVWDAESGQETLTLKGHSFGVMSVAFSPDGRRIVSGSLDETLKVWDAESGQEILTLKGHSDRISSVALSRQTSYRPPRLPCVIPLRCEWIPLDNNIEVIASVDLHW